MTNALVKEYVRAIRELKPRVFVMENVGMLKSEVHRFYYSYEDKASIDSLEKLVNRLFPTKESDVEQSDIKYAKSIKVIIDKT